MSELYTYWKGKEGANVIFTGKLKMLEEGTIGILDKVFPTWCSIVYAQNEKTNKVYSHSAELTEIKMAS